MIKKQRQQFHISSVLSSTCSLLFSVQKEILCVVFFCIMSLLAGTETWGIAGSCFWRKFPRWGLHIFDPRYSVKLKTYVFLAYFFLRFCQLYLIFV